MISDLHLVSLALGTAQSLADRADRRLLHAQDQIDLRHPVTRSGERRDRAEELGVVRPPPPIRLGAFVRHERKYRRELDEIALNGPAMDVEATRAEALLEGGAVDAPRPLREEREDVPLPNDCRCHALRLRPAVWPIGPTN